MLFIGIPLSAIIYFGCNLIAVISVVDDLQAAKLGIHDFRTLYCTFADKRISFSRRDVRAAEGARLEIVCMPTKVYRGFKSRSLRHFPF